MSGEEARAEVADIGLTLAEIADIVDALEVRADTWQYLADTVGGPSDQAQADDLRRLATYVNSHKY